MKNRKWVKAKRIAVMVAAIGTTVGVSNLAFAQVGNATIKGQVTQNGAPAKAAMEVVATNHANGNTYRSTTKADGSYVLPSLPPGDYEIQLSGAAKSEIVTVHVGETADVDLALPGDSSNRIVIVGAAQRADVKTSEVGTSVSRQQIENLPQIERNFLSFSDLAPGVRFQDSTLRGGAQAAEHVNVFIDGVGQKNYALRSGVSGQYSSRGNPFPQAAISEYKVLTQNYKAEYDQVSSVAITAASKSGTNEVHGEAFWDHTSDSWTKKDPFQIKREAQGVPRAKFDQDQYGFSIGGPIVLDRIHYFFTYEAKDNKEPRQSVLQNANGIATAGVVPSLQAQTGSATKRFQENLIFGKLDWQLAEDQHLEVTLKYRGEKDDNWPDSDQSAVNNVQNKTNDETRLDIKHTLSKDDWTNESHFGYEKTKFNPRPGSGDVQTQYKRFDDPTSTHMGAAIFETGGITNVENKQQKGILLQDDFTYVAIPEHTLKTGAKYKRLDFDLSGSDKAIPIYFGFIGLDGMLGDVSPIPNFENNNFVSSPYVTTANGKLFLCPWCVTTPPAEVSYRDNQYGIYLQDDWQVNAKLELNLGMRWDYEDNMLNNDYVMPADLVTALHAIDTRAGAAPGQTYAQSLAKGGVNIDNYIANGSRKPYKGEFQPRLGFSYDLLGDKASVLFGGWGRAFDRSVANFAQLEKFNNSSQGGEVWGLRNDYQMPYADQLSMGFRQQVGAWNTEIAYTNTKQYNQLVLFSGNRDPNGGFGTQGPADPLWGSVPGRGNLVLGDFVGKSETDVFYVKADKPYTKTAGWGASLAYTNSTGKTTNAEGEADNPISWTSGPGGKYAGTGMHPVNEVERHRVVATGSMDIPFGMMLSGKFTWGSGLHYTPMSCTAGCFWYSATQASTKQLDLSLSKDVTLPGNTKLVVRADVLNVTNTSNWGGYDRFPWDSLYLQPTSVSGPMRTFKLGVRYVF